MNYHHLSIEERSCIRKYYVDGLSYREIARLVGRNVSTISREIRRNCTDGVLHRFGLSVWNLQRNIKACFPLRQGGEAGLALSLAAHNRIRFPVPGFLTTVYRLVPFADGFPFTVFPSCFLDPVAFPLAPQHFQVSVHQVFLIDPAVDGAPAWHLQLARRARDLFR